MSDEEGGIRAGDSPSGGDGASSLYILGFGNPGRRDDGLGPIVAGELERLHPGLAVVETAFQPALEQCAGLAASRVVLFIDAARKGPAPFSMTRLQPAEARAGPHPSAGASFTTHLFGPRDLLAVCEASFGARPSAWLFGVRGYHFGVGEGLSGRARRNARMSVAFLGGLLCKGREVRMAEKEARTKTILIVDDDPDVRAALRIVLESAGFTVGEAANGESGLKIAQAVKPDAILLDLMMETVDAGSEVSTRLKEAGFTGPIYLLSAAGDSVRYNIGTAELGLAGIFQKPVNTGVLISTLRSRLKVG
jgi:hydrogenase maturation protease